ncbi:hypothetical protein [Sphingomonas faeni]|uniref:hypothetical protein n=1 Tax=Sphingomonas faeni TaxID=185950 RepID=UPI0033651731
MRGFADELAAASGLTVAYLIDERGGTVETDRPKIRLTQELCESIGLFCPGDFAWRCGDYGFYLARRQFPEASFYWQIEFDVRFRGPGLAAFFAACARDQADLLAADFGIAKRDWWWRMFAQARDVVPYRAFFPVTRLSAHAVDNLLAKRVAHSRQWLRRNHWPNDEAFVATTLAADGRLDVRDLKEVWPNLYDAATFTFTQPIKGEDLEIMPINERLIMYHPVLFGQDFADKLARLKIQVAVESILLRVRRKVYSKIARLRRW